MSSAQKIRAENNTILLRPHYEVLKRLTKFASTGEDIDTPQFGRVRVGHTVEYKNAVPGNNLAWGEVVSVGRGASWMKDKYRLDRILRAGDIIGFDACQFSTVRVDGEDMMLVPVDAALCRFNPDFAQPQPLGVYFMSVEAPEASHRMVYNQKERSFVLTANQAAGEFKISDAPGSKVKMTLERIVSVGGGGMSIGDAGPQALGDNRAYTRETIDGKQVSIKCKEPVEIRPDPECAGMLAMFMTTMSVDMRFDEKRYRFSNWDRIRAILTD
jgi:hypothetical protein